MKTGNNTPRISTASGEHSLQKRACALHGLYWRSFGLTLYTVFYISVGIMAG